MNYPGLELSIFKHAVNWKHYWSTVLSPYIGGHVCEVGAGLGGSTGALVNARATAWTFVEPDPSMAAALQKEPPNSVLGMPFDIHPGTLNTLEAGRQFDTIAYIDVLEHLEEDRAEFSNAMERLRPGGHVVAISPALQALYSEFDRQVGHCRRYSLPEFKGLADRPDAKVIAAGYLDSLGAFLSLANRLIARQATPAPSQIKFWDRAVIPLAKPIDGLIGRRFGRSVFLVARKLDS